MIVLHALWYNLFPGKLHIWGESSSLPVATKRGGRPAGQTPGRHPFALSHDTLMEAVGELAGSLLLKSAASDTLTLRLPSSAKGPLPSPQLVLEDESIDLKATGLKPWHVSTLTLAPAPALDFLLALPNNAPRAVAFGISLRYWAEAAEFSFELVARQCFAPTLQENRNRGTASLRASWEAVLAGEDDERLSTLSAAMPPLCWSFVPDGQGQSSLRQDILLHFLNATVDAFVRESLSVASLLPARRGRRSITGSLPERWLQALSSDNPTLVVPTGELESFSTAMRTWLGQLQPVDSGAAFRTCFRLDPPSEESDSASDWRVSFHLQANDDRSLLVPADKVWKERSSTLTFLKRKFENPQERLLADLGRASRLFPAIEESLRTARPSGLVLDTAQAYAFLRESAPLLEQSGFGVLVPPWWSKPTARLGVKLKLKPKAGAQEGSGLLGLQGIVAYDWTIAVGDTTLTVSEFEKLVNLKVPLIQVRGQWVELRPEEIEAAIAFFKKKHGNGNMALGEALRIGLGQEASEVGLPVTDIQGDGWIKELLDRLTESVKISPIEPPSTFHGKLRPYQVKGVSWLAFLKQFGFGACLADDMGLGKCLSACSLIAVNGILQKAEDIWDHYAGEATFDGEGYWADPTEPLLTNSIEQVTGQIMQAPIKRVYRQQVHERLRKVRLEDGSSG